MDTKLLTGKWHCPGDNFLTLHSNGSAEFFDAGAKKSVTGSWRQLDSGTFETSRPIPPCPDGQDIIPGYNLITVFQILSQTQEKMEVQGYEGALDGLALDSELWVRKT